MWFCESFSLFVHGSDGDCTKSADLTGVVGDGICTADGWWFCCCDACNELVEVVDFSKFDISGSDSSLYRTKLSVLTINNKNTHINNNNKLISLII